MYNSRVFKTGLGTTEGSGRAWQGVGNFTYFGGERNFKIG